MKFPFSSIFLPLFPVKTVLSLLQGFLPAVPPIPLLCLAGIRRYLKLSSLFLYLKRKRGSLRPIRILLCAFLPAPVCRNKASMNLFFRFQPGCCRILKAGIGSKMVPLSFESDRYTVMPVLHPRYPAESAGIVTAMFSFFQPFHAGTVHQMELLVDIAL